MNKRAMIYFGATVWTLSLYSFYHQQSRMTVFMNAKAIVEETDNNGTFDIEVTNDSGVPLNARIDGLESGPLCPSCQVVKESGDGTFNQAEGVLHYTDIPVGDSAETTFAIIDP